MGTSATKPTILVLLPGLGADGSDGIEDLVRIIFGLDTLQSGIILAEKVLLPVGLVEVGLSLIVSIHFNHSCKFISVKRGKIIPHSCKPLSSALTPSTLECTPESSSAAPQAYPAGH